MRKLYLHIILALQVFSLLASSLSIACTDPACGDAHAAIATADDDCCGESECDESDQTGDSHRNDQNDCTLRLCGCCAAVVLIQREQNDRMPFYSSRCYGSPDEWQKITPHLPPIDHPPS